MSGTLAGIWIKPAHGAAMTAVTRATLEAGRGIAGNADQGGWRQVTLLDEEHWRRATADLGPEVDPRLRRANLLVRGIPLANTRGTVLDIGDCRILIRGETRPCRLMDEQLPGLRAALGTPWAAGAFGEVLTDGTIAVGDPVGRSAITPVETPGP